MNAKKVKKIIKELVNNEELDKIINLDDEQMLSCFNDIELCEFERKRAQEYKDCLDVLGTDIEDIPIIPLVISCQSVFMLQTIIFKLIEEK